MARRSGRRHGRGLLTATLAGLTLAGVLSQHNGHHPATASPAPTPPPTVADPPPPWAGIAVAAGVVLLVCVLVAVAVWRLRHPTTVRTWNRAEALGETAVSAPQLETRTWHYILAGRTADTGWVELGRGYVDWPAADHREMEAEVVRRAHDRQPEGIYRARATPAVRQPQ